MVKKTTKKETKVVEKKSNIKKEDMLGGIILITIGIVFLLDTLNVISGAIRFWPIILIEIGAYKLYKSRKQNE